MLNRIRESLVNPGALIQYRNDSLFKALGYMLFFALFMSVSMVIMILAFTGVSGTTKQSIMNDMVPLETNCKLEDAQLICDEPTQHTFYQMGNLTFSINTESSQAPSDYPTNTLHFIIHDQSLILYGRTLLGASSFEIPLSELNRSVHNLDFAMLTTNPSQFEVLVFRAVDDLIIEYRAVWGSLYVISSLLSGLFLFSVFITLNTFLTRARLPMIPLKQMFVMMTYAGTALYIVLIFNSLWNFSFFVLIILLLVAFRQMNRLTLEIQNRVYRQ